MASIITNTSVKNQLLELIKKHGFINTTSHLEPVLKHISPENMNKKIKFQDVVWKSNRESSLQDELAELERLLKLPSMHFMESPERYWSEFHNFVRHIDF